MSWKCSRLLNIASCIYSMFDQDSTSHSNEPLFANRRIRCQMLGDLSGERKKQNQSTIDMALWLSGVVECINEMKKKKLFDRFRLMPNLELYPTTFTHIYNSDGGRKKKTRIHNWSFVI
ncbi:hypothetical protein OUZ56_015468 [Daphnia magna]|uniref:Uncharacterized protein n=1 Tax=Daphnia magna TaxID=35525 RepID=A0ABR0AMY1_9CRUS|nr:hypothetical protein OUZ56_015468 [Daphnia magna]